MSSQPAVVSPQDIRNLASVLRCGHGVPLLAAEIQSVWQRVDDFWELQGGALVDPTDDDYFHAVLESAQVYAIYGRPVPDALAMFMTEHKAHLNKLFKTVAHERECRELLQQALDESVATNTLVHGFELDLSFEINGQLYNVELDGPTHERLGERLNDDHRDAFLRSIGYTVIRVPLVAPLPELMDKVADQIILAS